MRGLIQHSSVEEIVGSGVVVSRALKATFFPVTWCRCGYVGDIWVVVVPYGARRLFVVLTRYQTGRC